MSNPRRWWPSKIRARLTLLYAGALFLAGVVLVTLMYLYLRHALDGQLAARIGATEQLHQSAAPAVTHLPAEVQQQLREQFQQDRDHVLKAMLIASLISLGVVGVVATGFGWLMAGQALRPLQQITATKGLRRPIKPRLVRVPRPFGNGTAQRVLGTLRSALSAAVRAEEISRNVASQAEKPRYRRKKVRPWEPEQLGAWLDSVASERLYPLFHLGAFAGMRRGELVGLSWDAVNLDEGFLVVRWQITNVSYRKARLAIKRGETPVYRSKPKTRDGEERTIHLDPDTVEVLRLWKKQQDADEGQWGDEYDNPNRLVFTRENGEPSDPHYVYYKFVRSVAAFGLPPVPLHLLRHIAASLLIAAGIDIAVISKMLGHSKIDLTSDTYGHLIGKIGKEAAAKSAKLVPRGAAGRTAAEPVPQHKQVDRAGKKGKRKRKGKKNREGGEPIS